MSFDIDRFIPKENKALDLGKWPTLAEPLYLSPDHYRELLAQHAAQLDAQQQIFYASQRFSLLLIFQGMDAAGKDSLIKHVMSGIDPQGCSVHSFKSPTPDELRHDFLWRAACALPKHGEIGIFNRSFYEDVLIVRVHPELLHSEHLREPKNLKTVWHSRYASIRAFEQHLIGNRTLILKFFLHISKEEQKKRFLKRLDEPTKMWKIAMADVNERAYWDDYMKAYEEALAATHTRDSPWYILPADDKKNARLIASQIILTRFNELSLAYPAIDEKRREVLQAIRAKLEK
jgi:PPK2 family polyphosphate:nucleotide phosphotransferase